MIQYLTLAATIAIALGSQGSPQQPASSPPGQVVTAELAGRSILRLCLVNNSNAVDYIVEEMLPWSNRYSITLIATRARGFGTEVLVQPLYSDHGFIRSVTLPPRKPLCGNIDLDERLPKLEELRGEDDVVLFWSYLVGEVAPARDRLHGGAILLPKLGRQ